MVKLCFFFHIIPLDPDPRTKMNADPTGSGSTSLTTSLYKKVLYISGVVHFVNLNRNAKHLTPVKVCNLSEMWKACEYLYGEINYI